MMRPSEVAALTRVGCERPERGWGHLTFADSSPARAHTDDGRVHKHRGLKGRTRGRPTTRTRKPTRRVPVPPELVFLLREHFDLFGTAPDGRLFRSENGNPIQPSTWWQVWQKVRKASLSAEDLAGLLMRRPYDLRHSGVTWRLNSGVPATEVAAWAGHFVEVLMRVYARCVTWLEDVWISRMDDALRMDGNHQEAGRSDERGGVRIGGGIWHLAAPGGTGCLSLSLGHPGVMPGQRAIPEVTRWRPSRIRTCAHGSGGRFRMPTTGMYLL
jgi:hypothetical protein